MRSEALQDLVGGLVPHERLGLVVPSCDPGVDGGGRPALARVGPGQGNPSRTTITGGRRLEYSRTFGRIPEPSRRSAFETARSPTLRTRSPSRRSSLHTKARW